MDSIKRSISYAGEHEGTTISVLESTGFCLEKSIRAAKFAYHKVAKKSNYRYGKLTGRKSSERKVILLQAASRFKSS